MGDYTDISMEAVYKKIDSDKNAQGYCALNDCGVLVWTADKFDKYWMISILDGNCYETSWINFYVNHSLSGKEVVSISAALIEKYLY